MMKTLCHVDPLLQESLLKSLEKRSDPNWLHAVRECVPICLDLMAEAHEKPAQRYEPIIRTILHDHCRIPLHPTQENAELDRHVQLLVRELERTRVELCAAGEWSQVPCPPLMFG